MDRRRRGRRVKDGGGGKRGKGSSSSTGKRTGGRETKAVKKERDRYLFWGTWMRLWARARSGGKAAL